ncbi:MAG: hypothetical protein R3321_03515 [Nitrososphaeraceae archaeon]|nr:hypothetical protein [Nitrososphaeraceae archaeon]
MTKTEKLFEVSTNGTVVWVNHIDFGAVGRFTRVSIDVHNNKNTCCKDCGAHKGTPKESWEYFKVRMKELHGVEVSDKFKPLWVTCQEV